MKQNGKNRKKHLLLHLNHSKCLLCTLFFLAFTFAHSQKEISNGEEAFIVKDILNLNCFYFGRGALMYNKFEFENILKDSNQKNTNSMKNNESSTIYFIKNKNIKVTILKEDTKYVFKINIKKDLFKYDLLLKKNYNLKVTKIYYPKSDYKYLTIYLKYEVLRDNYSNFDYFSLRFPLKNKTKVSFDSYF